MRGQVVRLKVRDPDFTTRSRQKKLVDPTCDDMAIYRSAVDLFDAVRSPMAPVRLLGVAVADLRTGDAPAQGNLFDRAATDRAAGLLSAMDEIRDRFGDDAIGHGL